MAEILRVAHRQSSCCGAAPGAPEADVAHARELAQEAASNPDPVRVQEIAALGEARLDAGARNGPGYLSRMFSRIFSGAIGSHQFELEMNPSEKLLPRDLVGKEVARGRVLADGELQAVWFAADGTDALSFRYRTINARDSRQSGQCGICKQRELPGHGKS